MTCRSKFVLLCVTIMLVTPSVRAQTDTKKERQELEKKTLALLNEIASGAWGLKLPENRIFIMASTADLLWSFDEKRARNLYLESLTAINSFAPAAPKPGEKVDRDKILQAYFQTVRLRQKVLLQVARRDSQLALDMLRATRQVPPRDLAPENLFAEERYLEQQIAGEIAARDPAQALQVARESLAKGFTWELVNLLQQLQQRDAEKASAFAGDIITKLQTTNVAANLQASTVALFLLEGSRSQAKESLKPLTLTDDQKRQLIEILINAALSTSANSNLLSQINNVLPEIEQFFPDKRAALERKLSTFNETLPKEQRDMNTYSSLIRRGMQDDLVRSAASADHRTQDYLYQQAAVIAVARGNTDAFREFLSKEISDSGERQRVLDYLDAEEISTVAGRKQLDRLRNLLPKIERKEERARAMAELAILLKEKGEDAEAATLLDEAAGMIKTNLKDEKQTNALLSLLCAYAVVDPPKAFVLAERTVDRANAQISLLMLLDRVVKSGAVKKSEIMLDQAGIMPLDFLVFKYGKGVAALAKADFNRTRALADRFDRNELRLFAQLLIVKGILQPLPEFPTAQ